jgi:hypothetical protein
MTGAIVITSYDKNKNKRKIKEKKCELKESNPFNHGKKNFKTSN